MRLIVITGMSGSGKSSALHLLEDLNYYCIDNIPIGLLPSVIPEIAAGAGDSPIDNVAVGLDVRSRARDLESLPLVIRKMRADGVQCDILFLETSDDVLLQRYSETRRRHPLARDGHSLLDSITRERELLRPLLNTADLIIDTSHTGVYELRDIIANRVAGRRPSELSLLIQSFGFKHAIPADADFVFDLRCLPNPYWESELRNQNGKDQGVIDFLDSEDMVLAMYDDILAFLNRWIPHYVSFNRSYLTIAIGCTGGQHRSVYMVEKLARALREHHPQVHTRHKELT